MRVRRLIFFSYCMRKEWKWGQRSKLKVLPWGGGLVTDNCCFFFEGSGFLVGRLNYLHWFGWLSSPPLGLQYIAESVTVTLLESPKSIASTHIMLFNLYYIGNSRGCRNSWHARAKRCHCEYLNALHQMNGPDRILINDIIHFWNYIMMLLCCVVGWIRNKRWKRDFGSQGK